MFEFSTPTKADTTIGEAPGTTPEVSLSTTSLFHPTEEVHAILLLVKGVHPTLKTLAMMKKKST